MPTNTQYQQCASVSKSVEVPIITRLAQKLLEKYKYPYLSIDHLKMGLIRSGNTELTPMSDEDALTKYLVSRMQNRYCVIFGQKQGSRRACFWLFM